MLKQIQKNAKRFSANGKGVLSDAAKGIGTDQLMVLIDNKLLGSFVQDSVSLNLPVLGNTGAIDVLNYIANSENPKKFSKSGLTAVLAAKAVRGIIPSIGSFKLPSFGTKATNPVSPPRNTKGVGF